MGSAAEPGWWLAGRPVGLDELLGMQASDYIEGDEWDLEWRLCRLPSSDLPRYALEAAEWEGAAAGVSSPDRFRDVAEWFEGAGSPLVATAACPVVLLARFGAAMGLPGRFGAFHRAGPGAEVRLLDGYHRTTVANNLYGGGCVYAVAGRVREEDCHESEGDRE